MPIEVIRVEGLKGVLDTLKQLPPEVVSKNGGPVRTALRKAAVIIQKQAQANVQAIIDEPNIDGAASKSLGILKANIIVQRIRPPRGQKGERFMVRVRKKAYPAERVGPKKGKTAVGVGTLLEQGTERRSAMPWMRPAFEAKKQEAVNVFERELPRAIDRIVKRLAKQNRVA